MEKLLECAICLDIVVDPRILPCHHSFCLECLENIETHEGNTPRCPLCNNQVHVTTPSQLPPDERANSLLRARTLTDTSNQVALQRTVDRLLMCTMCSDQLSDPRILPCHHSFCKLCVEDRHGVGPLTCPICGNQFHTTAANLPADFWVDSLSTIRPTISSTISPTISSTIRRTHVKVDKQSTLDCPKMTWVIFSISMAALAGMLLWTRMPFSTKTDPMAQSKLFEQNTNLEANTEAHAVLSSILQTCIYHMVRSKSDVDKNSLVTLMKDTFQQESLSGKFLETTPGLASLSLRFIHRMTQSRLKAENQKLLGSISLSCLEHWRESAPDVETRVLAAVSEMCITDIMKQRDDDSAVSALSRVSQTCLYHWTKPETSSDSASALSSVTQTCLHHWIRLAGGVESGTNLPSITQICMALVERSLPSDDDAVALYAMSEACVGHIIRAEPHTGHQVLASVSNICIGYLGHPRKVYTWKKTLVSILQTCVQYSGGNNNKRIKLENIVSSCMSHLTKYPSDRSKAVASIAVLGVNFLHRSSHDAEVETVLYGIVRVCLDHWTNDGSSSLPSASHSLPTTHQAPLHPTPPHTLDEDVEAVEAPSGATGVVLLAGLLILTLKPKHKFSTILILVVVFMGVLYTWKLKPIDEESIELYEYRGSYLNSIRELKNLVL